MRKIGILGGMFDPIHLGHLHAAQCALAFGLDEVLLLPCLSPAHRAAPQANAQDRLQMCALAASSDHRLRVSDAEMREGPCYAADTLRLLEKQHPDASFYWIAGADKLPSLSNWYDAAYLFAHCTFLICPRPGYDASLPVPGAVIHVLPMTSLHASSSKVIEALQRFDDASDMLPPAVARYIAQKGLYQRDFLPELLKRGMQEHRLRHTLGVRDEAVHLAALHGARLQAASVAAMLHDIAKPLPLETMQQLAQKYALNLPEEILQDGNLLHGPVAAAIAQHELNILDVEILSAIACHTTGKTGMTVLDMCVFLADAIESGRKPYPGLEEMRALSKTDLSGAVLLSMQRTQEYVLSRGFHFCPQTQEAMQDLIIRRPHQ